MDLLKPSYSIRGAPNSSAHPQLGSLRYATRLTLSVLSVLLLLAPGTRAQNPAEAARRAACIYKLTEFVDWPAQAFPTPQSSFVIGVLGTDPFGTILDELVRNEAVKNHKITVKRYASPGEITNCHLLFISPSEEKRLDEILSALKGQNILTVGDTENFTARGGVLRFRTERNTLRFRINVDAAKEAKLTISSKLLHMADLVGSTGGAR